MVSLKKYRLLEILQFLSIDVVVGTLCMAVFATRILNVTANPIWWIILPLSVWVVYSLDHIVDSRKKRDKAVIQRHRFHYIYRRHIITAIAIAAIICLTLCILFLEKQIIIYGSILSGFIFCYLLIIHFSTKKKSILLQKELIIAVVYTLGIFLAPLIWYNGIPSYPTLYVIFVIFLLAWFEGIMISWFDYDQDIIDGHTSFTIVVGKENTQRFLVFGHMLIEVSLIVGLIITPVSLLFYVLLILLVMNALLGIMMLFPESKMSLNYHRLIGDSVFILPGLIAFF